MAQAVKAKYTKHYGPYLDTPMGYCFCAFGMGTHGGLEPDACCLLRHLSYARTTLDFQESDDPRLPRVLSPNQSRTDLLCHGFQNNKNSSSVGSVTMRTQREYWHKSTIRSPTDSSRNLGKTTLAYLIKQSNTPRVDSVWFKILTGLDPTVKFKFCPRRIKIHHHSCPDLSMNM